MDSLTLQEFGELYSLITSENDRAGNTKKDYEEVITLLGEMEKQEMENFASGMEEATRSTEEEIAAYLKNQAALLVRFRDFIDKNGTTNAIHSFGQQILAGISLSQEKRANFDANLNTLKPFGSMSERDRAGFVNDRIAELMLIDAIGAKNTIIAKNFYRQQELNFLKFLAGERLAEIQKVESNGK